MLFNKPRAERLAAAEKGLCPDELLYGMRALGELGWQVEATDAGFEDYPGSGLLKGLDNLLSRGGRRTGFHLKQAWRLRRRIQAADVVLATADSSGMPVLFLQALGLAHTPVVYCSIGLAETFGDPAGLVYAAYRRLLARAAAVITYTQVEAEDLSRMFGLPAERVHFVPFGVETEFFEQAEKPSGRPLSFGLDHQRDWAALFAAAASLEAVVEVVTNPDLLRGLASPRNVMPLPPEPVDRLRLRLAAAPYVVLPVCENSYSGATISLLQAMAAGKAVVVSRTRAITEGYGLVDGENCLLVPPGDVPALAGAMSRLEADRDLAEKLGRAAAEHVRQHHHVRQMAAAVDRILREALT